MGACGRGRVGGMTDDQVADIAERVTVELLGKLARAVPNHARIEDAIKVVADDSKRAAQRRAARAGH